VATPLALHPHRVRAAFGKTARIEGDDAIELAQAIGDLSHQHLDQRVMIPRGRPDECLQDLSFDIDECGNVLTGLTSVDAAMHRAYTICVERMTSTTAAFIELLVSGGVPCGVDDA
jgi:hypothetical protein